MSEAIDTAPVAASKGKIVEALVRLGKAVQKSTIYPDGHPAVPAAVKVFLDSLKAALEEKGSLTLGVACDRMLLDGEAVEPRNPAIAWIAEHMYERGVGALDLARTTPESECVRFVQWLAKPPAADAQADGLPVFEGINLTRYDYARVHFGEDPTTDSEIRKDPVRVWLALMSGLVAGDSVGSLSLTDDPEELARQICARTASGEGPGATAVASRVIAMGSQLSTLSEPVREDVKKRIARFIGGLTQELRSELLRVDPRCSRQKLEFVTEMVDALSNTMVVEILGDLDRSGAHVPHQFITLMNKLIGLSTKDAALHEQVGTKLESMGVSRSLLQTQPDKMRGVLEEVLQSRLEKSYNPEHYQALLENLSMHRVSSAPINLPDRYGNPCEPDDVRAHVSEIVLQLLLAKPESPEAAGFVRNLEEDAPRAIDGERFDQVHRSASAVKTIVSEHPDLPADFLDLATTYLGAFSEGDRIEKILGAAIGASGSPPPAIVGLFQISGAEAAHRAFHRLASLTDGPEMRTLTELLISLEPEAFSAVVARLRQEGWASLRALFPVLQRIGGTRSIELALTFVGNEDPRVRIEAFRILLAGDQRPGQFERYLERALADESSRVAAFALAQARLRAGPEITQILAAFLRKESTEDDLRVKAVSILGGFKTPEARDVLVGMLSRRRIVLWVKQVLLVNALEEALLQIGDEIALQAVRSWRRSPVRWLSLLLVQGKVQGKKVEQ